ncbi:MAG: cyclic nucleotide-binding domain-containing protein [Calditrichia bacterium]|nr:cyclic nucleotide-binding domain-containing protein [Calditrichia bacterium]
MDKKIDTKTYLPFFRKVSLFRDLTDEQITKVITGMQIAEVQPGNIITKEGAEEDTLFVLVEGEVEITKQLVIPVISAPEDRMEKSLVVLTEKQFPFFGEMALFLENPERSATVKARKQCVLAMFEKKDLLNVFDNDADIGSKIYKNIASVLVERLKKANKDILKLTTAFTLALEG